MADLEDPINCSEITQKYSELLTIDLGGSLVLSLDVLELGLTLLDLAKKLVVCHFD
tara:strand:+ start:367 stop:534 length:168 start_codon:yes stop_codon:yes gene_type:complete